MLSAFRGRQRHQYEYNEAVPKVYLLETHAGIDEKTFFDTSRKELAEIFPKAKLELHDDGTLLKLSAGNGDYYFDPYFFYYDDRFAFRFVPVFTFDHSTNSDSFIRRLISGTSFFDGQWILYEDMPEENMVAMESHFDGKYSENLSDLNVRFETRNARKREEFLEHLKSNRYLGHLSSFKYYLNDESREYAFQAHFYYSGKVTLYGDGFEDAMELIKRVTSSYASFLLKAEQNASELRGVYFEFNSRITEPRKVLQYILDDTDSKFVGFDIFETDSSCRTVVADLHVGGIAEIVINSNLLRITIGQESCANSIRRLAYLIMKNLDPYIQIRNFYGVHYE